MSTMKRTTSKPTKKRKLTRTRSSALTRIPTQVSGTLIADKNIVRLKYADSFNLTVTQGGVSSYLFRTNSIHDPDFTAVGHQPLGHDQYAVFYNKYTVTGSRMTVTAISNYDGATTSPPDASVTVGVGLVGKNADVSTNKNDLMESNRFYFEQVNAQQPICKLSRSFDAKRFFGVRDALTDGNLTFDFGNNPAQVGYFHISAFNNTGNIASHRVTLVVMIEYDCVLTERKQLTGS